MRILGFADQGQRLTNGEMRLARRIVDVSVARDRRAQPVRCPALARLG